MVAVALGYIVTQCHAWHARPALSTGCIRSMHRSAPVLQKPTRVAVGYDRLIIFRSGDSFSTLRASRPQDEDAERPVLISPVLPSLLGALFVCSALLGPFLDGYHGAFDVLEYRDPLPIYLGGVKVVGTAGWVRIRRHVQ